MKRSDADLAFQFRRFWLVVAVQGHEANGGRERFKSETNRGRRQRRRSHLVRSSGDSLGQKRRRRWSFWWVGGCLNDNDSKLGLGSSGGRRLFRWCCSTQTFNSRF
ncbi:hypothetical protein LXL04_011131 [Taraxacum kok-saghyz]